MFEIQYTTIALKHRAKLQKSGSPSFKKLVKIIDELKLHPRSGLGRPEQLKYMETEVWSREIDKKNRITYSIDDEKVIVEVLTALGHYDDK